MTHWSVDKRIAHGNRGSEEGWQVRWSDEELLDALRFVARYYGKCTSDTYLAAYNTGHVEPSERTFSLRFGSWSKALQAAGLPTTLRGPYRSRKPDESHWDAIRTCAAELGRIPSLAEYEAWARARDDMPCAALVRMRLGGWRNVLRVLQAERHEHHA
jgi:hypothetical protein